VDGSTIRLPMHRFDALSVGEERIGSPKIGIDENKLESTEMLLGLDYLRGRKVWISYRTGQMFVQRP